MQQQQPQQTKTVPVTEFEPSQPLHFQATDARIGETVYFYPRDEWVTADSQRRQPDPTPAIFIRLHRGTNGEPTGMASLILIAEEGARPLQARFAADPAPDTWRIERAINLPQSVDVPVSLLEDLVKAAVAEELDRRGVGTDDAAGEGGEADEGADPEASTTKRADARKKR